MARDGRKSKREDSTGCDFVQGKESDGEELKTAQNALQNVLDVSEGKSVKVKSVPVPGSRRRRVIDQDSSDKG